MYDINTMLPIALLAFICILCICGVFLATYILIKIANVSKRKKNDEPQPTVRPINNMNLHLNELSFQDANTILNNIITHRVRTLVRREDLGKYDVDTLSVMLDELILKLCTEVDTSINTPLRVRLLMFVTDEFLTYYIHDTVQNILVLSVAEARNNRSLTGSSRPRGSTFKNASRGSNSKGFALNKPKSTTKSSTTPTTSRIQGTRILS